MNAASRKGSKNGWLYAVSLPERTVRSASSLVGGALRVGDVIHFSDGPHKANSTALLVHFDSEESSTW